MLIGLPSLNKEFTYLLTYTIWVAIVTPTDRPKSVRNRCVIEVFGGVYKCVVTLLFGFFYGCGGFCHRIESDLFLLLFRSYSELLSNFGAISFQEYVSKGITHPVFYGDLVNKLRRVKGGKNFISSGSKIVTRQRKAWHPLAGGQS